MLQATKTQTVLERNPPMPSSRQSIELVEQCSGGGIRGHCYRAVLHNMVVAVLIDERSILCSKRPTIKIHDTLYNTTGSGA
jgi:hypothetical protein